MTSYKDTPTHKMLTAHTETILQIVEQYGEADGRLFCWMCKTTKGTLAVIRPAPVLCGDCLPPFIRGLNVALRNMIDEGEKMLRKDHSKWN